MNILKFLLSHWDDIVLIFGSVAALVALIRRGELNKLREIGFWMVTDAEIDLGGGVGVLKKSYVMDWLYDKIPNFIRPLISKDALGNLIDNVILPEAKKRWADIPELGQLVGIDTGGGEA